MGKPENVVGDGGPDWFTPTLEGLIAGRELAPEEMRRMMEGLLTGACGEVETAALLLALRMKGETSREVAVAVRVLREHMVRLDLERDDILDTCGTGGDGCETFNISTATALVVAACGVPVVKHGNRAMSSRCGSADVLGALGVRIDGDTATAQRCLLQAGIAFCFAPNYHPGLRHVGAVRRRLGVRTLFNALGPLVNPAGASCQLLGVGRLDWLDLLAGALVELGGMRRAVLVCGADGLDEVSLSAPTHVREVRGATQVMATWTPEDFGLAPCTLDELRVSGVEESATVIRAVLEGADGPALRIVLANAAAALYAGERVTALSEGVIQARAAIEGGKARQVLEKLVAASRMTE
jgi:anthranilate phosphoribosyltransferase